MSDVETLDTHYSTNLCLSIMSDVETLDTHYSTNLSLSIMSDVESLDTHFSVNPSLSTTSEVEVLSTHSNELTFFNSGVYVSFCSQAASSAPDNLHCRGPSNF